jgi:hypothetical protein
MAESVLTAVITGLLVGYVGVLLALKQFKGQRAFERQLDWYERTLRALVKVSTLQNQVDAAMKSSNRHLVIKSWDNLLKGFAELDQCSKESVLYANQASYDSLCRMSDKLEYLRMLLVDENKSTSSQPVRTSDALNRLAEAAALEVGEANRLLFEAFTELSRPLRKLLGLKPIKLK